MADGKIYIIVTDQLPGGGGEPQPDKPKQQGGEGDQEGLLSKYARHKFFNLIETQAKQAINYSISNIGNFTGDYVKQQHVQDAMQVVSFMTEIAAAAYAGFKYTKSGYGAALGAVIAVAGKVTNTMLNMNAEYNANRRLNREISQLRLRAGISSAYNESRGTEN